VGNQNGQEARLKCGFDPSRNKQTFSSELLMCQEFRRRCEENAWKWRRIETKLEIAIFMLRVMTYVVSINWFGIEVVLCNLYLTRFDLTKGSMPGA